MLAIVAAAAGFVTVGALAWYKVLLPMDRMLELADDLNDVVEAPKAADMYTASRSTTDLVHLAAATGAANRVPPAEAHTSNASHSDSKSTTVVVPRGRD